MSDSSFPMFSSVTSSGATDRMTGLFPNPFFDYASTQLPSNLYEIFRWCEFLWLSYGTYRQASQRIIRYFLTKVELTDISDDETQKFEEYLNGELKIMDILAQSGDNLLAYGNDFITLNIPFRRHLRCPKCLLESTIQNTEYKWTDWKFIITCKNPKCKFTGEAQRVDRVSVRQDPITLTHWPVHEMRVLGHPTTGRVEYFWRPHPILRTEIMKGNEFYLANTPWEIVETIKDPMKLFRFNDKALYHMKYPAISGLRTYGWGMPPVLSNFKQAWYIQILKRYNEAIGLDHIVPFRVITPGQGSSREADPLLHTNLKGFNRQVLEMYSQHRRDPSQICALPFPINFQSLGADGRELAPVDLIDKATDELLNGIGVPSEFYRGTMQLQVAPTALRLFERTHTALVSTLNDLLQWIVDQSAALMSWEKAKAHLQPVTLSDDIEKKHIQLQLASGQQISKSTALAPFGINYREEVKRMLDEDQVLNEEMQRRQEEADQRQMLQQSFNQAIQAQQQGAMGGAEGGAQGGGAMPPGGQSPLTPSQSYAMAAQGGMGPDDLMQQADQMAAQMLQMPYESRRVELSNIKKTNETLHALVIQKMQSMRQKAKNIGGQQVLQQQVGGNMMQQ